MDELNFNCATEWADKAHFEFDLGQPGVTWVKTHNDNRDGPIVKLDAEDSRRLADKIYGMLAVDAPKAHPHRQGALYEVVARDENPWHCFAIGEVVEMLGGAYRSTSGNPSFKSLKTGSQQILNMAQVKPYVDSAPSAAVEAEYLLVKFGAADYKIRLIASLRAVMGNGLAEAKCAVEDGVYFPNTLEGTGRMVKFVAGVQHNFTYRNGSVACDLTPTVEKWVKPQRQSQPQPG